MLRDGHRVKLEGPWDSSIEARFDKADNQAGIVVEHLMQCESTAEAETSPFHERLLPQPLDNVIREQLGEVRSLSIEPGPSIRFARI